MKKPVGFYLAVVLLMAIAGLSLICGSSGQSNEPLSLEAEEVFSIHCWHGDCHVSIHVDTDSLALLQEVHTNLGLAIQFLKSRQTGKGGR